MNSSQQELLDAINALSKNKDRSFDTPATVLRVEGDTVWVHIDGGADETPVLKTVNCEQGETVQVRISNGSAFLVGNASAPPTDDKVANAAHFVAEQADIKAVKAESTAVEAQETAVVAQTTAEAAQAAVAQSLVNYETYYKLSANTPTQPTEDSHAGWSTAEPAWSSSSTDNLYFSVRTVKGDGTITWSAVGMVQSYADLQILKNAIISTVASDYVGQGSSGVTSLSSTMYQNTNGVNIYNGTLAQGDSYAHIDGDSFDIKEVATAGTISDANDTVVASFGATSSIKSPTSNPGETAHLDISATGVRIGLADPSALSPSDRDSGWDITPYQIKQYGGHWDSVLVLDSGRDIGHDGEISLYDTGTSYVGIARIRKGYAYFEKPISELDSCSAKIDGDEITLDGRYEDYFQRKTIINGKRITMDGNVYHTSGYRKTPTIRESETIAASETSYTFMDTYTTTETEYIYADSVIDVYDTIFGFAPTGLQVWDGGCTITFPAQATSHKIKIFIW